MLGYSKVRARQLQELHEVCVARLRRAEREARTDDVVLLSGRARRRRHAEADLMAAAWRGPAVEFVLDRSAGSTYGNALATASVAGELGADEVIVVTSSWHGGRAAALVRAALHESGSTVALATVAGGRASRATLRELACWPLVPAQRVLLRRAARIRVGAARVGT